MKNELYVNFTCEYGSYTHSFDKVCDELTLMRLVDMVSYSFNKYRVVDNMTGEVLYEHYTSERVFNQLQEVEMTVYDLSQV